MFHLKDVKTSSLNIMKFNFTKEDLKKKNIPHSPGCYLWKDINSIVLYVGKAKDLNLRTKSYFLDKNSLKVKKLMREVADVDYMLVSNENESLILESELIKKYKPKFNILLRENTTFPYIVLTKENHPRLLYTHSNFNSIKGNYYGPFAINNANKYDLFNFLNRIIPLRKCRVIPTKKCIYYDIGQCLGPCINKVEKKDYDPYLKKINDFFLGKTKQIDNELKSREEKSAELLAFEDAQMYYELRKKLDVFSHNQEIVFSQKNDEDVIGYISRENVLFLVFFKYVDGILLNKHEIINTFLIDENDSLISQIFNYYSSIENKPKNVYLSLDPNDLSILSNTLKINFSNPTKGNKKAAIEMALENAKELMRQKYLTTLENNIKKIDSLSDLEKILGIDNLYRIELFDNSFLFGVDKISAMVVYENSLPKKNLYRKFILGKNLSSDFHFMEEVIYRRYKSCLANKEILPNLIIVDGGAIQVKAALTSLKKLNLDSIIPVIGLAKNNNHKTDKIVKWNGEEILLDKKSNLYFFLLTMQDEVHRFAISFHRKKRSKSLFANTLLQIPGLGKTRIEKLISKFETVEKIKATSVEELSQVVPREIAIKIKESKW